MINDVLPVMLVRYPRLFSIDRVREVRCYGGWFRNGLDPLLDL